MWARLLVAFVAAVDATGASCVECTSQPMSWDIDVETSLCGAPGGVYDMDPLHYPAGAPDHCFPGGDIFVVVKSGHKTGTQFGTDLVKAIHDYCAAAATTAGAPAPVHPESGWINKNCGAFIEREVSTPSNSSVLLFCGEHSLWFNCVDVERITRHLHDGGESAATAPPRTVKLLHLVRDPVDMVLSGYNYHKSRPSTEPWLWNHWSMDQRPPEYRTGRYSNMTYYDTLQDLPVREGLALEADKMQLNTRHGGAVRQMASIYCQNVADPDYQPIRFKNFLGERVVESTCRLARFLGLPLHHADRFAAIMLRRAQDFDAEEGSDEHVTAGKYDKAEQLALLEQYQHYDRLLAVRRTLETGYCDREACELCFGPALDEQGKVCTT